MKNFMIASLLATGMLFAFDAPVRAQIQGSGSSSYAPNPYNRGTQPLSPYLNLLRGGNTAANYYYGVRPGLSLGGYGQPNSGYGFMGRQTFFPQIDTLYELEDAKPGDGLRPTGHPIGFNNTLGHFGAGLGTGIGSQRNTNQSAGGGFKSTTTGR